MADPVIVVEALGKRYRIGRAVQRHDTLRDAIAHAARAGARALAAPRRTLRDRQATAPEVWALRDLGFEMHAGEVLGIIGRNGAGKSTLLKVLSRITAPTTGRVGVRGRVGSLLEVGTGFHAELTGRENIYLSGAILGMRRREIDLRFDEIVAFAEVERFLDTPVKRYSSGMYLRLGFAVAAHLEPDILMVDEVLAVGDAAFQKKCLGRMSAVSREGRAVLFVSHNMNAVRRLCSRALLLEAGRLAALGETAAVVERYLADARAAASPGLSIDLSAAARDGSGEARFRTVRYGAGAPAPDGPAVSGGPLELVLGVESDAPRRVESLAVTVWDRSGLKLVNADTIARGLSLRIPAGRSHVRFVIDALNLNPGTYVVGLWLGTAAGVAIDHVPAAFDLEVGEQVEPGFGRRPVDDGLVPCRFDAAVVDESAAQIVR